MTLDCTQRRNKGLNPRALIAVDLFGLAAAYEALNASCDVNGLLLIADAAQSSGATLCGHKVGTLAPITTTGFSRPNHLAATGMVAPS